ncbi:MAG: hypothetical protein ACOC3V_01555 [bacterium]
MKDWKILKEKCEINSRFKNLTEDQIKQYKKEMIVAKRAYDNGINLLNRFEENKNNIQKHYVIPYLLGYTNEIENGTLKYVQVSAGASGGIDVDSDIQGNRRDEIFEHLSEKFGEDKVVHVGTFSSLGPSSAAKDLLRVYDIDYGESNEFTKCLSKELNWEDNIKAIQAQFPKQYSFYQRHKQILDLVPNFLNKVRQAGKHAGGIAILPKPVHNYVPVNRVNGVLATAFPESGQEQVLDEIGIVKYDILGISILDVIDDTINLIDEDLYLIEDDDGMRKVVGESYINARK